MIDSLLSDKFRLWNDYETVPWSFIRRCGQLGLQRIQEYLGCKRKILRQEFFDRPANEGGPLSKTQIIQVFLYSRTESLLVEIGVYRLYSRGEAVHHPHVVNVSQLIFRAKSGHWRLLVWWGDSMA